MEKLIEVTGGGICCDNKDCDFEDRTVLFEHLESWVDKPCPKCGHNLLTAEDFEMAKTTRKTVDFINSLSPESLALLGNFAIENGIEHPDLKNIGEVASDETVLMRVKIHDGVNIESIKKVKKEE